MMKYNKISFKLITMLVLLLNFQTINSVPQGNQFQNTVIEDEITDYSHLSDEKLLQKISTKVSNSIDLEKKKKKEDLANDIPNVFDSEIIEKNKKIKDSLDHHIFSFNSNPEESTTGSDFFSEVENSGLMAELIAETVIPEEMTSPVTGITNFSTDAYLEVEITEQNTESIYQDEKNFEYFFHEGLTKFSRFDTEQVTIEAKPDAVMTSKEYATEVEMIKNKTNEATSEKNYNDLRERVSEFNYEEKAIQSYENYDKLKNFGDQADNRKEKEETKINQDEDITSFRTHVNINKNLKVDPKFNLSFKHVLKEIRMVADCPDVSCEFGYQTDLNGKTLCSCYDPCENNKCGNMICIIKMVNEKFQGVCVDPATIERPLKCHLPVEKGTCRNYESRFYYNSFHQSCEHFIFRGCNGNQNNFYSWNECNTECDVCGQRPERGPCRGHLIRYYYDQSTQNCVAFSYGGCRGNKNNFINPKQCQQTCKP